MILLIGASGQLGSQLGKAFMNNQMPFIASSRNPSQLIDKLGANVRTMKGDLTATDTYLPALSQVDTLIICAHALIEKGSKASYLTDQKGVIDLINACKNFPIKHIILFSIFRADPNHPLPFFKHKALAEAHLIKSGIPFTILQCPAFMDFHIKVLIGESILKNESVKMLGSGQLKTNFVAVQDLVNLTLKLLNNGPLNNTILLGGLNNISKQDIVKMYGDYLGVKPKMMIIPSFVLRILAVLIAPFHGGAARLMGMAAYLDGLDNSIPLKEWPFGVQLTSVNDFVKEHIDANK